jgi:hypothetical protein
MRSSSSSVAALDGAHTCAHADGWLGRWLVGSWVVLVDGAVFGAVSGAVFGAVVEVVGWLGWWWWAHQDAGLGCGDGVRSVERLKYGLNVTM